MHLGTTLVTGINRVPLPATGIRALRTIFLIIYSLQNSIIITQIGRAILTLQFCNYLRDCQGPGQICYPSYECGNSSATCSGPSLLTTLPYAPILAGPIPTDKVIAPGQAEAAMSSELN